MAKKRRRNKAKKGGEFEREFCKTLSLWITQGQRDDVYWRTAGSGARATTRAKDGRQTDGHYGDIVATGTEGRWFLREFTLELKRGYSNLNNTTVSDCVTSSPDRKVWTLHDWIRQAKKSARLAQSHHWMLIHRPDNRDAIVYTDVLGFQAVENIAKRSGFGNVWLPRDGRRSVFVGFFPLRALWRLNPEELKKSLKEQRP